jgi:hypothetical protein
MCAVSLDHLISSGQQRFRNGQAERLGGLEVDYKVELGRPLDGELATLLAFEDTTDVPASLAMRVKEARTITQQPADLRKIKCWQFLADCKGRQFLAMLSKETVRMND